MARGVTLFFFTLLIASMAFGASIPIGFISWDVHAPGSAGAFDISNETGGNATVFPDQTFPVVTPVSLGSLSLLVNFNDGSSQTFGPGYFTLLPDGSFDGSDIPIGGANPLPVDATLTGTFSPTTIVENDGSVHTIDPGFSTFFSDSPNLVDGDLGIIYANESSGAVPEPAFVSWMLLGTFFLALIAVRNRHFFGKLRTLLPARRALQIAAFLMIAMALQSQSWAQVKLNAFTSPSTGVAGIDFVNATGSGFPSGTITPADVTVTFALSCGGPTVAFTSAASVTHVLGTSYRVHFQLPGTLTTATYFVQVSDSTAGDANFTSTNCSQVAVTHTSSTLSACLPSSSLGVLSPTAPGPVTAYVPNGCWECSNSGIQAVQLETGGGPVVAPASIPTPGTVNSCSSNPATGQTVCTSNLNDVYEITGSTLNTTLTSGSNNTASFSGGNCKNCGVAINALSNKAYINMGFVGISGDGIQALDLATNTFAPPVASFKAVSENISIDPTRGYILSPSENFTAPGAYDLFQIDSHTGNLTEFSNVSMGLGSQFLDSAAEDCSTGIALSTSEGTTTLFLADLTQATLVPGAPGSWSAPEQFQNFPEFSSMGAGTSGISVAPGTAHLGIVAGEFGSFQIGVIQLPSTSGVGVPAVVDYAATFLDSALFPIGLGLDPHTLTAYTSANTGKAFGVLANYPFATATGPSTLAVVDLACVMAAPRSAGTHNVTTADAAPCIRYVSTH